MKEVVTDATGNVEQLVKYLADVHSIELQALAQLRPALNIAGDERLCRAFERHLVETEDQERRVRERLEDLGGKPSKLKDAAGAGGGWAMAAFAAAQPDTPGKLTMHAYSYEHMEVAAYDLLRRLAERVDDEDLKAAFREHLEETREHQSRIEGLLEERGARPSLIRDAVLKAGGLNLSAFFGAQPDTTTKLAGFAFAFEHLEIAAYELLQRVAARAGDEGVVTAAAEILAEERAAAARVAATWDRPDVPLGLAS
jgi:ferritin-like metal-binding protein YciE